jgi:methyl-accepting chemotaxis protein
VTATIDDVNKGAADTGVAAEQVMSAATLLSRQASQLSGSVSQFITGVKAA